MLLASEDSGVLLGENRRMSKDYERLPETGEVFIYVAKSRLMARRWPAH
jgi:hypothetical protein